MKARASLKTITAALTVLLLVMTPVLPLHAQTVDTAPVSTESALPEPTPDQIQVAETTVIVSETSTDTQETTVIDTSSTQDAATADVLVPSTDPTITTGNDTSAQETIPSDTLVQTEDPTTVNNGGGGGAVLEPEPPSEVITLPDTPSEEATTTTPIAPDEIPVEGVPVVSSEIVSEEVPPEAVVDSLPMKDISPKEGFKFSIKNNRIPTTDSPDWKVGDEVIDKSGKVTDVDKTADITDEARVVVNATTNTLKVSGSCSMKYFVILLYKNQTDYDTDPAAYILNRAFPCTNGKYSYGIEELPPSIPNGTYYLLVGEMGDTGSWTPITSLVPISVSALQ